MSWNTDDVVGEGWVAIGQADASGGTGDCARVVTGPSGRATCFIGDVAGHDARAARMARQLETFLSRLAGGLEPGALLSEMNAALEASWPSDLFVSAVCFSVDPSRGEGSIAAAGLLPPIVKGASSARPVEVSAGPPLGVAPRYRYFARQFKLAPGEVVVAATDGVTDPLATAPDWLGLCALARLVELAPADPAELCVSLLGAARRSGIRDDATVLAVAPGRYSSATRESHLAIQRAWLAA